MRKGTVAAALLRDSASELGAAGIESPRREAELLLAGVLGVRREHLIANPDTLVPTAVAARFRRHVARRCGQEPLAYITGRKEFMSLDLEVSRDVLVPRPDTETLVDNALARLAALPERTGPVRVADVGTGSGAVGLAIAYYCQAAHVVAIDVSPAAVAIARRNATALGLSSRVRVLKGDLFDAPDLAPGLSFDLIVANLPYVPAATIARLAPGVAIFEPRLALDGGDSGLATILRFVPQAAARLARGGSLGLECDPEQCKLLAEHLAAAGFSDIAVTPDLAGRARNVWGYWRG